MCPQIHTQRSAIKHLIKEIRAMREDLEVGRKELLQREMSIPFLQKEVFILALRLCMGLRHPFQYDQMVVQKEGDGKRICCLHTRLQQY